MPRTGIGDITYTVNQVRRGDTPGRFWNKITLVFPQNGNAQYTTGGIVIDLSKLGLPVRQLEEFNVITDAPSTAKFAWEWNGLAGQGNAKLQAYTTGAAAQSAFPELADLTSLGANGSTTVVAEIVGY